MNRNNFNKPAMLTIQSKLIIGYQTHSVNEFQVREKLPTGQILPNQNGLKIGTL